MWDGGGGGGVIYRENSRILSEFLIINLNFEFQYLSSGLLNLNKEDFEILYEIYINFTTNYYFQIFAAIASEIDKLLVISRINHSQTAEWLTS